MTNRPAHGRIWAVRGLAAFGGVRHGPVEAGERWNPLQLYVASARSLCDPCRDQAGPSPDLEDAGRPDWHLQRELRDRIQNHTLQDVSSKNYDCWNYMPEKRAAMKKWNAFVVKLLSKKTVKHAA
jgi:hypothetical protein